MNEWIKDLNKSAIAFENIVKPELIKIKKWENVKFHHLESCQDDLFFRILDKKSGIDLAIEKPDDVIFVALRIQPTQNYETFTIRYSRKTGAKTEWEKRCSQIDSQSSAYPRLTMQAYVGCNSDIFLGAAITHTKSMYEKLIKVIDKVDYIKKIDEPYFRKNGYDGNIFLVCPYKFLVNNGVWIKQIPYISNWRYL